MRASTPYASRELGGPRVQPCSVSRDEQEWMAAPSEAVRKYVADPGGGSGHDGDGFQGRIHGI